MRLSSGSSSWDEAERKCSGGLRPPSLLPERMSQAGLDPVTMWSWSRSVTRWTTEPCPEDDFNHAPSWCSRTESQRRLPTSPNARAALGLHHLCIWRTITLSSLGIFVYRHFCSGGDQQPTGGQPTYPHMPPRLWLAWTLRRRKIPMVLPAGVSESGEEQSHLKCLYCTLASVKSIRRLELYRLFKVGLTNSIVSLAVAREVFLKVVTIATKILWAIYLFIYS